MPRITTQDSCDPSTRRSRVAKKRRRACFACVAGPIALWACIAPASAQPVAPSLASVSELADLSLEQLANVVVTTVSRREERLAGAPASVFVITAEDIHRSRATSIAEALRLAPNLDVARADVNQYAISARGFNNVLANKMLVLIDGRVVYTPLFSGVFWEAQDVLLEDVERIEVISGPGATLWGANAVNGVINVITRPARDTQGLLALGVLGDRQSGTGLRYGGNAPGGGHYRVYAKYDDREPSRFAAGASVHDASIHGQAGFRADWVEPGRTLTLQGDTYFGNIEQPTSARTISGSNLLARYSRDLGAGRSLMVQAYYDYTERDHPQSFHEDLSTADIEAQYGMQPWAWHKLLIGGGYRYAWDRVRNGIPQAFVPADRKLQWAHVFVQDEIAVTGSLALTAGAKVETNVYTSGEFLPNVRLAWTVAPQSLLWAALSRAVRAPSRFDRELNVPGTPPFNLLQSDAAFKSEISDVAEVGFRTQATQEWSYSLTAFYHRHDRLRSYELVPGHPSWGNRAQGHTHGVEGWTQWRAAAWWRMTAGGVLLRQHLSLEPGSLDPGVGIAQLGNDPRGWWSLRSLMDITPRHELDIALRRVGSRPNPAVPAYTAVDARLGFRLTPTLQLSLVVQNALDPSHPEWGPGSNRAELERAYFVKVVWQP